MLRKIVLATASAGALAFVAYSTPAVPTVLAAGVQLKSGLSGLVGVKDNPDFVLVKEGGGKGKGGKGRGKGGGKGKGHGDGGGKGKGKSAGHGDGGGKGKSAGHRDGGGKSKGKSAGHRDGDYKRYSKRGDEYRDRNKGHAKRGDDHRDGDRDHKRRKSVIVYRDGHRYWHDRRIWWWGPLVYSYDPCLRWVRFCPDCAPEQINICYDGYYEAY
jgi:hypothetical protein